MMGYHPVWNWTYALPNTKYYPLDEEFVTVVIIQIQCVACDGNTTKWNNLLILALSVVLIVIGILRFGSRGDFRNVILRWKFERWTSPKEYCFTKYISWLNVNEFYLSFRENKLCWLNSYPFAEHHYSNLFYNRYEMCFLGGKIQSLKYA